MWHVQVTLDTITTMTKLLPRCSNHLGQVYTNQILKWAQIFFWHIPKGQIWHFIPIQRAFLSYEQSECTKFWTLDDLKEHFARWSHARFRLTKMFPAKSLQRWQETRRFFPPSIDGPERCRWCLEWSNIRSILRQLRAFLFGHFSDNSSCLPPSFFWKLQH